MVDAASIAATVLGLVATVFSALLAAFVTYRQDRFRSLSESEKLMSKYRDPLLLATMDLQSRFYNILDGDFLSYYNDAARKDFVTLYTFFLVGQYFSWIYILRRQIQFLRVSPAEKNQKFSNAIRAIEEAFSTDQLDDGRDEPFMLWRAQQKAIGETMTIRDGDELLCMEYSKFSERISGEDVAFKMWFLPITEGMTKLVDVYPRGEPLIASRLRRIQHLLLDLVDVLNPENPEKRSARYTRVGAAPSCNCSTCSNERGPVPASDPV